MFFLVRDHKARTHGVLFALARRAPTLSDAHAPFYGLRKIPAVVWVRKMRRNGGSFWLYREPQVFVDAIRRNHLSGIHFSIGIPYRLELTKPLDQLRSEHFRQKLCACLSVPVLAGKRSPKAHAKVRRLFHKRAPFFHPGWRR